MVERAGAREAHLVRSFLNGQLSVSEQVLGGGREGIVLDLLERLALRVQAAPQRAQAEPAARPSRRDFAEGVA